MLLNRYCLEFFSISFSQTYSHLGASQVNFHLLDQLENAVPCSGAPKEVLILFPTLLLQGKFTFMLSDGD